MANINFGTIHHRGFELCLNDTRMLRGLYRRNNPDISFASLNKLPRKFLIDKLLIAEFSPSVMADYRRHCDMMDKFERIANGHLTTELNSSEFDEEIHDEDF